jgi:NAD(P)-dependent dehydrogenase (short-subunit alcohol dehydrogenase family)
MSTKDIAVVTGGSRGIGKAIAVRLARVMPVMLVGRSSADLQRACQTIRNDGGEAISFTGDVARPSTARQCVERIHKRGYTVRHLICSAGIGKTGDTHTFDPKVFAQVMKVNVNGAFYFAQACLPDFLASGTGTICMISSVLGVRGYKRDTAYTASKHAVVGLCRALHAEYARTNVRVVPLCPGFVESDMTARFIASLMRHRQINEAEARAIVAGGNASNRILPIEEVTEVVASMCFNPNFVATGEPLIME